MIKIRSHRSAYKELFHATKGFKDRNLLGAGGFGRALASALPAATRPLSLRRSAAASSVVAMEVGFVWA